MDRSQVMKIDLDIAKNINHQFRKVMGGEEVENGFFIDPSIGSDNALSRYVIFPGGLELYHFGMTKFKVPIEMRTINKLDSKYLLVHVNLSQIPQVKNINGEVVEFHKHLPIGILFCGPGLEMRTRIPPDLPTEVASIRVRRSLLLEYLPKNIDHDLLTKSITYEDIDQELHRLIVDAIIGLDDKLKCHSLILKFLQKLISKIQKHDRSSEEKFIHPQDLEQIMQASTFLRNPSSKLAVTVDELAQQANMGATKFKNLFKLVFGKPPKAYHNRIRMEYAYQNLVSKAKTPSEISYELGYSHPSNFTLAYKKYFGKLPSEVG